jgi:hypothetical protein
MAGAERSGYGDEESPHDIFTVGNGDVGTGLATGAVADGDDTGVFVTVVYDDGGDGVGADVGYDAGEFVGLTVGNVVADSVGLAVGVGACCSVSSGVAQKKGGSAELAQMVS